MKNMLKKWVKKLAVPFWAALYFVIFRGFAAVIIVSLSALMGVWLAGLTLMLLYFVWGLIFYIVLLQSDSIDGFKDLADKFLEKRKGKFFVWFRKNFIEGKERLSVSPIVCMLVFIAESPLTGVPLIRLSYPKNKFWKGVSWILIGSALEVLTWYLPIYGGGFSLIKWIATWLGLG